MRVFATGTGRKTDPVDAHSVALAALHAPNLRRVEADPELVAVASVEPAPNGSVADVAETLAPHAARVLFMPVVIASRLCSLLLRAQREISVAGQWVRRRAGCRWRNPRD
ncbi:hypothetical protein [Nocardia sp. NPDC051981]|uniref:hypothetical protein n=1 Tax=Nocardia sp. NPDC051981 TaxID=3155417 RepID=UPI00343344DD